MKATIPLTVSYAPASRLAAPSYSISADVAEILRLHRARDAAARCAAVVPTLSRPMADSRLAAFFLHQSLRRGFWRLPAAARNRLA